MEYLDLTGKVVKEGDLVVFPQTNSTSSAYLCIGTVTQIKYLPKSVKVTVEVSLDGDSAWKKDGTMKPVRRGSERFSYTEGSIQHSKLLILNRNEI